MNAWNTWSLSAFILSFALIPCGYLCLFKKDSIHRLVGLEAAGVIQAAILLLLAQASERDFFFDVALTMAILTYGSGLVFVRFLERWE